MIVRRREADNTRDRVAMLSPDLNVVVYVYSVNDRQLRQMSKRKVDWFRLIFRRIEEAHVNLTLLIALLGAEYLVDLDRRLVLVSHPLDE